MRNAGALASCREARRLAIGHQSIPSTQSKKHIQELSAQHGVEESVRFLQHRGREIVLTVGVFDA